MSRSRRRPACRRAAATAAARVAAAPPLREALAGEVFRHPRAQRDVRLDGHLVAYEMRRARRRSIGFVVGPEGLSVSVPRWVGLKEVDSALQDKRGWILRKLREQRERAQRLQSARIDWRDGTELPFLGDTVILVLDARATGAVLDNGCRRPAGRGASPAAHRPAAHRHARADPRRGAELAAAPGAAHLRGALRASLHSG